MFVKAFILLVGLSTAYTLKCYNCNGKDCKDTVVCPTGVDDRCSTLSKNGVVMKGCANQATCIGPMSCCKGDLCNGAVTTGPALALLLLSSAIFTLFL